jgi:hypothetical protein
MNIALLCTDIWYRVVHLLLTGAMVNYFILFSLFYFCFIGYSKIAANVRALRSAGHLENVQPGTEAD